MISNFNYKKSLGQNFLKDNNIIDKISDSISPMQNDLIVEIGPGSGVLTKKLVNKNCDVICFEIDKRLEIYLNNLKNENLKIIYTDFLKIRLADYINVKKYNHIYFVGNLPYYITTAIINKIIEESNPYEIVIMVQKEVGNRFIASPKSKNYSSISVFLQYNFNIEKVIDVSKHCFEPIPKVESVVLKLKREKKYFPINEKFFYKFVRDSFKQKRKTLKNNLKSYDIKLVNDAFLELNLPPNIRAEELSIEMFINLSNNIYKKMTNNN